jgi:hypothetical protein
MIRKSVQRFSEKIMLKQKDRAGWRFEDKLSRSSVGEVLERAMYSDSQFANLEIMCRERAVLAKREIEYWLAEAEYWIAEAEEWKQFRESRDPVIEMTTNRPTDLTKST